MDPKGDYEWPEPQSLTVLIEPQPYPVDALPGILRKAVEEVRGFTKAPLPLVVASALGTLSVAAQHVANVKRAEKLVGPITLYLLSIADSGERKTTCDEFFSSVLRDYEREQTEKMKPEMAKYKADFAAWEAERAGLLDSIKRNARQNKQVNSQQISLQKLELKKPVPPRIPKLVRGDETPENLAWTLAKEWPSSGVISSEAGLILGAHGMGRDSIMRNLTLLNILWDGGELHIGRRTSESFSLRGARLTVALQVQERTLKNFFDRSEGLARGTGWLARFLIAWPESTQGSRLYDDPPIEWPGLEGFRARIRTILNNGIHIDDGGALILPSLELSPEAKTAWIAFYNSIECELGGGGQFYDVRDVAAKTADNAVRLAALFHILEHGNSGAIGVNVFQGASRIAAWHLHEARRFFGELALPENLANAARLNNWLMAWCRKNRKNVISRRVLQQHITPVELRDQEKLTNALNELIATCRVRELTRGRNKDIEVNPALPEVNV